METEKKLSKFAKFAWFTLVYNVVVVVWGVFLRASKSGDGCGQHWLTCHGEVIPSAPEMKTLIEFSHRVMSGLDFLVVLALLAWTFRKFEKGTPIRKFTLVSFVFIVTEALIGAGLVLTGNTAEAVTPYRPFWAIGHLLNTFVLLAFLTLTAWSASRNAPGKKQKTGNFPIFRRDVKVSVLLALAVIGIFFVGMSGSIAALSNMLFPSASLAEGIQKDFAADSSILLRLRILHPISSIAVSVFLIFLAGWLKAKLPENKPVGFWSGVLSLLVLLQIVFGALTLLTGAPILMQLIHLLLADGIWISFVLLAANFLTDRSARENLRLA